MSRFITDEQLIEIAHQFGTPVFVYDAEKISAQFNQLKNGFAQLNTQIFYACKALTNIQVLKHLKNIGSNIDCSSINEVKLAMVAGFRPEQILYTSNGISFSEIEEAKNLGVHINIDSLSHVRKFAEKFGESYPVGIRIRPNIMAGGNLKISTGHDNSKFGIPIENIPEVASLVANNQIKIKNLHLHTGSDIEDVEVFVQGIEVLFKLLPLFPDVQIFDLGGGFKVPYHESEKGTNIPLLAKRVQETFEAHYSESHPSLQIWIEPGKFLVSECGYFITTVNVLKETPSVTFASVNSGFNHLIRPMFYDAYHSIFNLSNKAGKQKNYAIVGNICETDTFAWNREINEIREGDLLVFKNAGAYGFEMASNFNSRLRPAEVLMIDEKPQLIRKRESFEDLLRSQIY